MKTHLIVFKQLGENMTTDHDPVALFDPASPPDLSETTSVCFSSDNDMLVEKTTYSVREVELPDWLAPAAWLYNPTKFKYAWAAVGKDAPERLVRWAMAMPFNVAYAVGKLLATKTFRSAFRESLANQVKAWLAGTSHYDSPLSSKQLGALCNVYSDREAKRLSGGLYSCRSYGGRELSAEEVAAASVARAA